MIDSLDMVNSTLNFSADSTVDIFDMASDAMGSTNSINLTQRLLVLTEIESGAPSTMGRSRGLTAAWASSRTPRAS